MRKLITITLALALSCAVASAQGQLDFNNPSIPAVSEIQGQPGVTSGHAISLSVLGLEYSYEKALGGNWSLIARAGLSTTLTGGELQTQRTSTSSSWNMTYYFAPSPAITLEPRYYTNMDRRFARGKKTVNNGSNFVSIKIKTYYCENADPLHISAIPCYGIRRAGEHWFREYTAGVGFHSIGAIIPHLGFRLGYTF